MDGITLLWFCLIIADFLLYLESHIIICFIIFILILDCCEALWDFLVYLGGMSFSMS